MTEMRMPSWIWRGLGFAAMLGSGIIFFRIYQVQVRSGAEIDAPATFLTGLIALLLALSLSFRYRLFGSGVGGPMFAAAALAVSIWGLLFATMTVVPVQSMLVDLLGTARSALKAVIGIDIVDPSRWVISAFRASFMFLMLMVVLSALMFRRTVAVPVLFWGMLIVVLWKAAGWLGGGFRFSQQGWCAAGLLLGYLLTCVGACLAGRDGLTDRRSQLIVERLGDDAGPRGDTEVKARLLAVLSQPGSGLRPDEVLGIVRKTTGMGDEDPRVVAVARRCVKQLVSEDRLARIADRDGDAVVVFADPDVTEAERGFFWVSSVPSLAFCVVVAGTYMISPIDIIPDVLPIVGVVDDVALAVLAACGGFGIVRDSRQMATRPLAGNQDALVDSMWSLVERMRAVRDPGGRAQSAEPTLADSKFSGAIA